MRVGGQRAVRGRSAGALVEALTARELDVLRAMARGLENREIAAEQALSVKSIEGVVGRIYVKLGARNRVEAVVAAIRQGLVQVEGSR